ncbi:Aldo/keto reductase [Lyophyllum atratum]|nr:Aldo/keto reductase [Lyophyllum atratum]
MPFGTVKLNDGNEIPAIAFGTGSVNKNSSARDIVMQAIETGFSHIDTAQIYHNEASVGEAIRESGLSREELFITTKYFSRPIQESVRDSLAKLGIKSTDLYLIHTPATVLHDLEGAWKELEKVKEDGLTRSIGISNFNVEEMQKIMKVAKVKPAVNQIELHPYNYAEQKKILEYSAKHDIVIEAYSSLTPITKHPGGPVDAPVNAAAKRLSITPTQVILAWAKAKGVVIVTTSSRKERLEEYLAVADLPPLTDEEIAAIDLAGAKGPPATFFGVQIPLKTARSVVAFAAACVIYTLYKAGV